MTEYILNGRRMNVENVRNHHDGITYKATDIVTGNPVFELSNDENEELHGICRTFHENGKVKCDAEFEHGQRVKFREFDENGTEITRSAGEKGMLQETLKAVPA